MLQQKVQTPQAKLVETLRATSVTTMRKPKAVSLRAAPKSGLTGFIFGPSASGKTEFAIQLACGSASLPPQKILYVNTDIGSGGTDMIIASLLALGREDAIDNFLVLPIGNYEEFSEWVDKPWTEEILSFAPDVLFWEGFGFFQSFDLTQYVLGESLDSAGGKDGASALREEKLVFEKVGKDPSWEARKTGTLSAVDRFCRIRHPEDKFISKVLTMFEGSKQEPVDSNNPTAGSKQVPSGRPLLSGYATFDQVKGASDFLIKTHKETLAGKTTYQYVTGGPLNAEGKLRGRLGLNEKIEADACALWSRMLEASNLNGNGSKS